MAIKRRTIRALSISTILGTALAISNSAPATANPEAVTVSSFAEGWNSSLTRDDLRIDAGDPALCVPRGSSGVKVAQGAVDISLECDEQLVRRYWITYYPELSSIELIGDLEKALAAGLADQDFAIDRSQDLNFRTERSTYAIELTPERTVMWGFPLPSSPLAFGAGDSSAGPIPEPGDGNTQGYLPVAKGMLEFLTAALALATAVFGFRAHLAKTRLQQIFTQNPEINVHFN